MTKIIVSKFGGSSMRDDLAMFRSAQIAKQRGSRVIVVSATYGTTDLLVKLIKKASHGDWSECEKILFSLRENHFEICSKVSEDNLLSEKLRKYFNELETLAKGVYLLKECSLKAKDQILSFGERMSSLLFTEAYNKTNLTHNAKYFDAREIIITNDKHTHAKPLTDHIENLTLEKLTFKHDEVYITQGFIGKTLDGSTTTLGRGGSDYSAALIAQALNADVLEIWTDVAGIASTDPRICENAIQIKEISYNEAQEMAQYGAKILHPTTLVPAMKKEIPVFVASSYDSQASGTWIKKSVEEAPLIRAITKRDNQVLLTISTPKMLDAVGFMSNIFNVFTKYEVSVDCVTTSEISVAISIDESMTENKAMIHDLKNFGEVSIDQGYSLVSLIGNGILSTAGLGKTLFNAVSDINVRMLCLGASAHNLNMLVKKQQCHQAISCLHDAFIGKNNENSVTWTR